MRRTERFEVLVWHKLYNFQRLRSVDVTKGFLDIDPESSTAGLSTLP